MKNLNKGFVVLLLLGIIAVLVVGGGVYVYKKEKKADVPVVVDTNVQQTSQTKEQTRTQTSVVTQKDDINSTETSNWKTYTNTDYGFSIQYPADTQISDTDTTGGRTFYFNTSQGMVMVQGVTQALIPSCNKSASGADRTTTRINGVDFITYNVSKEFSGKNSYSSATEYCAVVDGTAWRIIPRIGYAPGSTPPDVNNNVTLSKMVASFKILIMP